MGKVFVTLEKFKFLKQEIRVLKSKGRRDIADKLSEYRDTVDLIEDSSYTDVLQSQADLEKKISEIEEVLENAVIIKERKSSKVTLGSQVVVRIVGNSKKMNLRIVGTIDADPTDNNISYESPLGRSLIGKKKGDMVELILPVGSKKFKILEIK